MRLQQPYEMPDPYEAATAKGLVVVEPWSPYEVQLDIDTPEDLEVFESQLALLRSNNVPVAEIARTVSAGGNTHVYLRVDLHLSPVERIALQATLGSDRKRELLSFLRTRRSNEHPPTVLFETPQMAATLERMHQDIHRVQTPADLPF